MKRYFFFLALFVVLILGACRQKHPTGEWISIFDGKTFNGWKKSVENPESITIKNGAIRCSGPRAHLFYRDDFKNFELEAEVKTEEKSNSGIFLHTRYQAEGWPKQGYEIQINNSYRGSEKNPERRKTGSIYNVRNIYFPLAKDEEWFTVRVKVMENLLEVFVNDVKVNEYIEPENPWRAPGDEGLRLGQGTIALQAHDPGSTTWFRNIRVKALPGGEPRAVEVDTEWDTRVTKLMRAGFPLIDYHVHLKGGLTIEELIANGQKLGINYGVAPNCGLHFPVTDDASLFEYVGSVKGSPSFKGMQAEGREWITLFSPEAVAEFDYVFTDAMTFTDAKGRRNRIWIPEEVWVEDKQQFMDQLVEKIEAIFSREPVDIYVNPTVLPDQLMGEYDELWTDERLERVVKVLAENDIALEINARYRLPKEKMIRMAKAAGVKFTFGTNNTDRDLGRLEYCLEMTGACRLTPNDMFEIRPDHLKPVRVKGFPDKITG
jgi:hypothetical protein